VDRLAVEGVRFTQGYAPSSTCTPSRYALLTGEYAWRQKTRKNTILDGDAPLCIEPGRVTLPSILQKAGYTTGIVGKWHLGLGDGQTPVNFNSDVKPGPLEVGFNYCHIIPATVDRVPSVWIENHRVVGFDPADPIVVSYLTNISDEPTGIERPDLLKQKADTQHSCTIINGISRIGYRLPFIRLVLSSVGQDYHTTRPEKSESRHLLLTAFLFTPLLLSHNPGLI
jgi:hypothetical protein